MISNIMGTMWADAGGRTRAVMKRNEAIFRKIEKDIQLITVDRIDNALERAEKAKERFNTSFEIIDLFEHLRENHWVNAPDFDVKKRIYSHFLSYEFSDFRFIKERAIYKLLINNETILTFWNEKFENTGFPAFFEKDKDFFDNLISSSKVIIGFQNGRRLFRIVNDMFGKPISFGKYDESGKKYILEKFISRTGEVIFEFRLEHGFRKYKLYSKVPKIFEGERSESKLKEYIQENYLNQLIKNGPLIIDEPKHYNLGLRLDTGQHNKLFYFHWHNFGEYEKNVLNSKDSSNNIIFLTESQKEDFAIRAGVSDKDSRMLVLDNMLEKPKTKRKVTRSQDGKKRIIFIGRLAPEKNVDRVIKVFAEFKTKHPSSQLTIIGDGPERNSLEQLVEELGLNTSVYFKGNKKFPYETDAFKVVDLALLTPKFEAYGLVFPELISLGIPVVTIDVPYGPKRWIINEKNGYIISEKSTHPQISDVMEKVMLDDLEVDEVAKTLNIDNINNDMLKSLKEIL